ncbi:Odorant degrading enzyme CXE3, partial [Operophtera brumata]
MTQVKVTQGWLEGEELDLVTGDGKYYSFKGIPYAEPPLGQLRFKAPRPALPWEGVKKATSHGPVCPQQDIFTNEIVDDSSEDCLYLNIYTLDLKPKSPLPVMVFIHGGGYKSGSGNEINYGPDFLVNHGVLLVTINYRLDALGFLCLDTEDVPGNAGMKDQVAALRWVKENIANFGGDASNITVFGESAGGSSAALHLISPMSKGLFQRAISMSGVPNCDWSLAFRARDRAFVLGKLLGIETQDPNELLEFLQKVSVDKLVSQNPTVISSEEITNNILKMYHFTPVIEKDFGQEHFLTEPPFQALANGKINSVDLLIGHTNKESLIGMGVFVNDYIPKYNRFLEMVVPRELLIKCTPDTILEVSHKIRKHYFNNKPINIDTITEFVQYASDTCFVNDIHRFIRKVPKTRHNKRYFYQFSCLSERNVFGNQGAKYGIYGAAHLDDMMYLFDPKGRNIKLEKNSKEYSLIKLANTVFTNFAKYGEDCLYLNVYTRDLSPKSPLPVMVFIHGTGYKNGSGNEKNYGPDFLVNHGVLL